MTKTGKIVRAPSVTSVWAKWFESIISYFFFNYYGDQIMEYEMDWECSV
jgi:hypothetical protein